MSIYPSPDKLDAMESKYALVILAAKRARQVKDGARKLVDTISVNPLTIALEEIGEGTIIPRVVEDATVTAQLAALKPTEPTLEDIIGAGPVLAIEPEMDSHASQLAALRRAEPDADDDELVGVDREEELTPVDAFALGTGGLGSLDDDDDDMIHDIDDDDD